MMTAVLIFFKGEVPALFTLARIKYELETLLECPVGLVRLQY